MDFESYLTEQKAPIMAINRISQMIDQFISENYYKFGKDKFYIDEVRALNTAIQMTAFCMRYKRRECYVELDENYQDEFTYDSVMYENL
jgi:hypothetical protein